jgi:hypothetical protein
MIYVNSGYTYKLGPDGYYYLIFPRAVATSIRYTEQELIDAGFVKV